LINEGIVKKINLLFFLVFILFCGPRCTTRINAKVNFDYQDKIPLWLAENNVPAIGIGIIEDGKIKSVKVFGELQKDVPAPINTIFEIASMIKSVEAMLTLK